MHLECNREFDLLFLISQYCLLAPNGVSISRPVGYHTHRAGYLHIKVQGHRLAENSLACPGEKSLNLDVLPVHDVGQQEQDVTLQSVTGDGQIILADFHPLVVRRPYANWYLEHVVANLFQTRALKLGNVASVFDDLEGRPHLLAGGRKLPIRPTASTWGQCRSGRGRRWSSPGVRTSHLP